MKDGHTALFDADLNGHRSLGKSQFVISMTTTATVRAAA